MTAPAVLRRWGAVERHRGEAGARRIAREQLALLRKGAPLAAVLVTAVAAHAGLAPHLAVLGLEPDVLLVAVVAVAAGRGARGGAAFGFAAGLGADLFLATPLGTSALAYTLVGHVVGRSSRPRRAALRRSVTLAFVAVATGRAGTAVLSTALGAVPFPKMAELLHIVGVAALSAPLGIPAMAAARRFGRDTGARR